MKKSIFKNIVVICYIILFSFFLVKLDVNASTSDYKYYTYGIVDGGIYKIKNVETGLYMNVSSTSANSLIKLSTSSNNNSQKFVVKYLGNNRYQIEPLNNNLVKLKISSSNSGSNVILYNNNSTSSSQRFKILAINSSQYNIFSSKTNYETALCSNYDSTNGYHVVHINNDELSSTQMKWEFEKTDITCDIYNKYYLKDYNTGLYFTLPSESNNTQITLEEFTGKENQRFKQYISGSYQTLIPMKKTDIALEYNSLNKIIVNTYDNDSNQKFRKYTYTDYYRLYTIIDDITYYIAKDSNNNVILSSNYSSSIRIVFEEALFETSHCYSNYTNTICHASSADYGSFHLYHIRPDHNGEYNFFVNNLVGNISLSFFDSNGLFLNVSESTHNNIKEYKLSLQKDKIYFIKTLKEDSINCEYYYNCLSDLIVYLHGTNTSYRDGLPRAFDCRTYFSIPSYNYLQNNKYYDPIINNESDLTSNFVTNIDPITGIVPLQAPIYIFTGHGVAPVDQNITGVIYSTGTNYSSGSKTYLYSTDIFDVNNDIALVDMTGNKFSVWAGCKTTKNAYNIAYASWIAGSLCSMGFSNSILGAPSNTYLNNLVEEINNGYSINDAIDRAYSRISIWFTGLASAEVYGDGTQVLKPHVSSYFNIIENLNNNLNLLDLSEYTFKYENTRKTVKRYVKLINGIETDDYIDIYTDGIEIKGYYKSKITYDNDDIDFSKYFKNNDYNNLLDCKNAKILNCFDYILTINEKITPVRLIQYEYNYYDKINVDFKIIDLSNGEILNDEVILQ